MTKLTKEAEDILIERFGKDNVIALATNNGEIPSVRYVNSFYYDGAFYVLTNAKSNKMNHIKTNSLVALAGDWFTAHGKGLDLGYFGKKENEHIAKMMREIFAEWIDKGHNDFSNENTCILKIELVDGVLFSHGTRYDIDFTKTE